MDTGGLGKLKELHHEIYLRERFATADGDAAVFAPVSLVAQGFLEQILCAHFNGVAALEFPGFRVVTKQATHGAALQEYDEANSGAVYRAEGFQFIDESCRHGANINHVAKF